MGKRSSRKNALVLYYCIIMLSSRGHLAQKEEEEKWLSLTSVRFVRSSFLPEINYFSISRRVVTPCWSISPHHRRLVVKGGAPAVSWRTEALLLLIGKERKIKKSRWMFINIMLIFLERFSHHYVMESRMHAHYELIYRNAHSVVGCTYLEWELRMRTMNLTARTH